MRTRTPSALKWLAEERAALAGELVRLDRLLAELEARRCKVQQQLSFMDGAIRQFDEDLTPEAIRPVNAWKGKYGKRGALKALVIELLGLAGSAGLDTNTLTRAVIAEFGLPFVCSTEISRFQSNSIRCLLKELRLADIAESIHDSDDTSNKNPGIWRLKKQAPTLAELRAQRDAIAAGTH